MRAKREFVQVLRKFDDSRFKPLPRTTDLKAKGQQLYDNLWSMFGTFRNKAALSRRCAKLGIERPKLSVADFAWSKAVSDAFYAHRYHRFFVGDLKKHFAFAWGLWVLDSEPCDIEAFESAGNEAKSVKSKSLLGVDR